MNQNHPGSALDDRGPEYLPRMNEGCIQDPSGYQHVSDHPMLRIQKQGVKLLLTEVPKKRAHPRIHVRRTADGLFPGFGAFPVTPELYGICSLAAVVLLFMVGLEKANTNMQTSNTNN